jgi:transaldolase
VGIDSLVRGHGEGAAPAPEEGQGGRRLGNQAARPGVLLDRDGVLNRVALGRDGKTHPPASVAEVEILPGVPEALALLRAHGYVLVGVSNQPDIARGAQSREKVDAINRFLLDRLSLEDILVCPHDDSDDCPCRKPRPGLLFEAARRFDLDLAESYMVGDRGSDIEAGRAAGCLTALLADAYNPATSPRPDVRAHDLLDAARQIAARTERKDRMSAVTPLERLDVKIFADGADIAGVRDMAERPWIRGFTTNPTLMHKQGIRDYCAFAREVLKVVRDRPISFEVFSDEFDEMERQAREIASWAPNVTVKIPVTNTRGESSASLIRSLRDAGVAQNVTAILTLDQVREVSAALAGGAPSCVSVFAGRIADTGVDPIPTMSQALRLLAPGQELIWASPRELLNVFQAAAIGCHIITLTGDLLRKAHLVGKDLRELSLETVKMFHDDAHAAGFSL